MGVRAQDGTPFHSAGRARMHDEMKAGTKPAKAEPEADTMKKPGKTDGEGGGQDVSHMQIGEVVEKHGPAHKVELHHDHEANTHKKISHHGDHENPHMHTSEHGSMDEAYKAAHEASGMKGEDNEMEEELHGKENPQEEMAEAGTGIPGLTSR